MIKLLATADWHVDDKNIDELEKCLDFLVNTTREETPDIFIHSGDIFNSRNVQLDSKSAKLVFRIFSELANIAPVIAILGTKSHDGAAAEVLAHINAKFPVTIASFPEQIYFAGAHDEGCLVSMVPAPTKKFWNHNSDIKNSDAEIAGELSKMFMGFAAQAESYTCKGVPHILVYHGTIRGAAISESQVMVGRDLEIGKDQIEMSGCDIALCGHIHFPQKIGDNIFYSGSISSLNWGELHDHGFYIHEFNGRKLAESRFIQTPSRKRIKLSEDLTGAGDITDLSGIPLMEMLLAGDAPVNVKDAAVRVEFKVFQDEATKINLDEIKTSLMSSGAKAVDAHLIRVPRENVRSQKILKLTSLRDKLCEMAKLKQEVVPASILEKADMLESEESDKIIARTGA